MAPDVHEYRLHQLRCPHCGGQTRAHLPDGVSQSGYGERLAAVVALLSGRHHQSHGLLQALLRDVFEVSISVGAINRLRREVNEALATPVSAAKAYLQRQAVIGSDETGLTQHNGDGANPHAKRGWLWVLVSPLVCVFEIVLSRSQATAKQVIGAAFRVIWRRLSFGSKSQAGSEFVARMLTVTTTLKAQKRSVLDFLTQACRAARFGHESPSLIPNTVQSPIT